jgi:hypothetical protein
MSNIFLLDKIDDFTEKINIDELYEKKRQYDLNKLELFNKILNRIHVRIKTTSRQKIDEQYCWFVIPEIIIGVPKYDQAACIAYLIDKLKTNGFSVKYIHPNTLLITWNNWVPSYVRSELKHKTGVIVNEFGQILEQNENIEDIKEDTKEKDIYNYFKEKTSEINTQKKYTPIKSYKPSGNLY